MVSKSQNKINISTDVSAFTKKELLSIPLVATNNY